MDVGTTRSMAEPHAGRYHCPMPAISLDSTGAPSALRRLIGFRYAVTVLVAASVLSLHVIFDTPHSLAAGDRGTCALVLVNVALHWYVSARGSVGEKALLVEFRARDRRAHLDPVLRRRLDEPARVAVPAAAHDGGESAHAPAHLGARVPHGRVLLAAPRGGRAHGRARPRRRHAVEGVQRAPDRHVGDIRGERRSCRALRVVARAGGARARPAARPRTRGGAAQRAHRRAGHARGGRRARARHAAVDDERAGRGHGAAPCGQRRARLRRRGPARRDRPLQDDPQRACARRRDRRAARAAGPRQRTSSSCGRSTAGSCCVPQFPQTCSGRDATRLRSSPITRSSRRSSTCSTTPRTRRRRVSR